MTEIPISQTWFKVILDTQFANEVFENAKTIEMKFKSPSGIETKVEAERVGLTSEIQYELEVDKTVLNELGQWAVWPFITANDNRVASPKRAIPIIVIPEGTV